MSGRVRIVSPRRPAHVATAAVGLALASAACTEGTPAATLARVKAHAEQAPALPAAEPGALFRAPLDLVFARAAGRAVRLEAKSTFAWHRDGADADFTDTVMVETDGKGGRRTLVNGPRGQGLEVLEVGGQTFLRPIGGQFQRFGDVGPHRPLGAEHAWRIVARPVALAGAAITFERQGPAEDGGGAATAWGLKATGLPPGFRSTSAAEEAGRAIAEAESVRAATAAAAAAAAPPAPDAPPAPPPPVVDPPPFAPERWREGLTLDAAEARVVVDDETALPLSLDVKVRLARPGTPPATLDVAVRGGIELLAGDDVPKLTAPEDPLPPLKRLREPADPIEFWHAANPSAAPPAPAPSPGAPAVPEPADEE